MLLERASRVFKEQRIKSYTTDVLLTRVSMLLRQTYVLVGFQTPDGKRLGDHYGQADLRLVRIVSLPDLRRSVALLRVGGERGIRRVHGLKHEDIHPLVEGLQDKRFPLSLGGRPRAEAASRLAAGQRSLQPRAGRANVAKRLPPLSGRLPDRPIVAGTCLPHSPRPGTDRRQPGGQAVGNEAVRTLEAVRHAADGRGNAPAFCENEGDDGIAQTLLR